MKIPCTKWGNQKKKICKRGISKEFFVGDKTKLVYFADGKDFAAG
jgi:hypothetical protein